MRVKDSVRAFERHQYLVRPQLALEPRLSLAHTAAVVGTVDIGVALASRSVAVHAVVTARLVVAHLVALGIIDPRGEAAVGTARGGAHAVLGVPRARGVVAGLIAVAVVDPRHGASHGAELLHSVVSGVACPRRGADV